MKALLNNMEYIQPRRRLTGDDLKDFEYGDVVITAKIWTTARDEPYAFTAADVAALATLRDTPALVAGRVHLVDGKALSWYGPRIAAGVRAFAVLLDAAR